MIEGGGAVDGVDQPLPAVPALGGVRILGEGDPGSPRQQLQGIGEADVLRFLDPSEHIAAPTTTKAVIQATGSVDRKRRRFLLMKRTDGHHRAPRPLHLGDLLGQLDEIGPLPDPVDIFSVVRHGVLSVGRAAHRSDDAPAHGDSGG